MFAKKTKLFFACPFFPHIVPSATFFSAFQAPRLSPKFHSEYHILETNFDILR